MCSKKCSYVTLLNYYYSLFRKRGNPWVNQKDHLTEISFDRNVIWSKAFSPIGNILTKFEPFDRKKTSVIWSFGQTESNSIWPTDVSVKNGVKSKKFENDGSIFCIFWKWIVIWVLISSTKNGDAFWVFVENIEVK
jgi:hypothetical protein